MLTTNKALARLAVIAAAFGIVKAKPKTVDNILAAFTSTIAELEEVERQEKLKIEQHVQAEVDAKKAYYEATATAQAGQVAGMHEAARAARAVERFNALVSGI